MFRLYWLLLASGSSSSSRVSHKYKLGAYNHIVSVNTVSLSD